MRTSIETSVKPVKGSNQTLYAFLEFNQIVALCVTCKQESILRQQMNESNFEYFDFGFGGHHMWVTQKEQEKRILFLTF